MYARLTFGLILAVSGSLAHSQTCASPLAFANSAGTTCAGGYALPGLTNSKTIVYKLTTTKRLIPFGGAGIVMQPAGFDPALVVTAAKCDDSHIIDIADYSGFNSSETLQLGPINRGTYFVIATSLQSLSCGSYSLSVPTYEADPDAVFQDFFEQN